MKYKKRFYKVYDKLPEAEKKMPIYEFPDLDDVPMTWKNISDNVKVKSKAGQEALNWLARQEII